jgi:hypothetical protein
LNIIEALFLIKPRQLRKVCFWSLISCLFKLLPLSKNFDITSKMRYFQKDCSIQELEGNISFPGRAAGDVKPIMLRTNFVEDEKLF